MQLTTGAPRTFHRLLAGAVLLAGFSTVPVSHAGNYGGNCVPYQLKAYGGEAGVRTLDNPDNFRRTNGGHISGQFCGSGRLKVELSKRDPGTHVALRVNGYEYTFGEGDRGDRRANQWFRRYYQIDLPRYDQQYGNNGYDHGEGKKHQKKRGHKNKQYDNSYGYQNKQYNNGNGYHENYQPKAYKQKHSHGHGIGPKPRLRVDSGIHRKAHKLHLPHQHKRDNYAYQ